jgi:hypothetical protein
VVGSCEHGNETAGYIKESEELSSLVEPILASQGRIDSIELDLRNVLYILRQLQIKQIFLHEDLESNWDSVISRGSYKQLFNSA